MHEWVNDFFHQLKYISKFRERIEEKIKKISFYSELSYYTFLMKYNLSHFNATLSRNK